MSIPFRRTRGALCALLCLGPARAGAGVPASEAWLRYEGTARTPEGDAVLYGEQHLLHTRDGALDERLVLYTCADGRPFARKLLHYGATPLAPDLRFEDARSGDFRSLQTTAGHRRLVAHEAGGARAVDVALAPDSALVADAGFDELIRRTWARLIAKEPVPFSLLLLSDGSVLRLKATHLRHEQRGGEDVEIFRVALSGLLGLLAPNIDVTYSTTGHVLRRFEGISNIRDERGHQIRTVIDFPASAHGSSDAKAWDDALHTPLVSRCAT